MTKWEYLRATEVEIMQETADWKLDTGLDELGGVGWELVQVITSGDAPDVYLFKRPKDGPQ
jgi:hypothetical protein